MSEVHGRIVVALNRRLVDVLTQRIRTNAVKDISSLRDAVGVLGEDADALRQVLEHQDFLGISSAVPNKTRSVRDQIDHESRLETPPRRSLVGVFALNASGLSPALQQELVKQLRALPIVASAYLESSAAVPASDAPSYIDNQTYLNTAPQGIGLKTLPPGIPDGTGIGLAVIDFAWNLHHETIATVDQTLDNGQSQDFTDAQVAHGTAALGLILGHAGKAILGIAPGAHLKALRAPHDPDPDPDLVTNPIAVAIASAAKKLTAGDVLLIEIQETQFRPVEVYLDTFAAIADATGDGIIVIEPAGNNTCDLEQLAKDKDSAPAWNPRDDDPPESIPDSGAIIVSGCSEAPHVHHRLGDCNHGDRVDCYAPGEDVVSAGAVDRVSSIHDVADQNKWYCDDFGGTSSASAIIAGVVLRIQSLARVTPKLNRVLTPSEIRYVLKSSLGTPIEADNKTWYMPDLAKLPQILDQLASGPAVAAALGSKPRELVQA